MFLVVIIEMVHAHLTAGQHLECSRLVSFDGKTPKRSVHLIAVQSIPLCCAILHLPVTVEGQLNGGQPEQTLLARAGAGKLYSMIIL